MTIYCKSIEFNNFFMKTVTESDDCFKCRACCRFDREEKYFAPVFTMEELSKIPDKIKNQANFIPHKKSQNVFQIRLITSFESKNTFVCPFYDEKIQKCRIYLLRPLDCIMWPIILTRSRNPKIININIVKTIYCQSLKNTTGKNKKGYFNYIEKYLNSDNFLPTIRKYPALVWGYESFARKIGEIKL